VRDAVVAVTVVADRGVVELVRRAFYRHHAARSRLA
jgi:hypothetical protein